MPRPGSIFTLDRRSINIQSADSILSAYIQSFGLSGGFSSVRLCPRIQRDLSLLRDHNMRGNMGLTPLLLFIMRLSEVYSGHSLQYYHTAVSVPGHGLPVYISVGYVDGIEISHYRSDDSRAVPVAPWMQKVEDPGYWERDTQIGKSNEASYKVDMNTLMKRYNQTGGFHSYQRMHGCELRDDGSIRGYWQYGFDGKDFLALDTERWVYIALTDQAQVSAQKWNSPELRAGERRKNYLENICIPWLRIHLKNGQEELERRGVCRVWGRGWRGEVCAGYGGGAGEERCVQGMGEELERRGVCRVWGRSWRGEVCAGYGGGAGEERCVQGMGEELERRGVCRVWGRSWRGEVCAGYGGGAGEERCVQGMGEELERRGVCRVWGRSWRGEVCVCRVWGRSWRGEVCAGYGGGAGEERCVQGMGEGLERRGVCRVWGRGWRGEVCAGYGGGAGEERCGGGAGGGCRGHAKVGSL
uniref:MHC class I-like antigen recognition-like domain-containing protein n=1 Tax=Leptobrachium leishanense TaxID=445787 RepID=A0A8C5N164_9ANUR